MAVNTDGVITLLNDSAQELLGVRPRPWWRRCDAVGLDPAVEEFLLSGEDGRDVVIATRTRVLALNRRAASTRGERIGTVTTMRDSTELASMQGQLSSHKSVTDTLRAQTHEFANQLHTISGLVQLGEYDSVRDLVGTLTRRRAEISDAVTRHIADPAVAALLIAKTSLAAESGVALVIDERSHLTALDPALATDVITVLGNLVDNAVDVSEGSERKAVTVMVDDADGLAISVADSGRGVPEHLRESIFARGVTSKPDVPGGRGIGLALVRLVSAQLGGTVTVSDGPEGGAVFEVRLPQSPAARHGRRWTGRRCVTCSSSTMTSWSPRSTDGSSTASMAFAPSAWRAPAPRRWSSRRIAPRPDPARRVPPRHDRAGGVAAPAIWR